MRSVEETYLFNLLLSQSCLAQAICRIDTAQGFIGTLCYIVQLYRMNPQCMIITVTFVLCISHKFMSNSLNSSAQL